MTKTSHLAFDVHAATIALGLLDDGAEKPEVWEIANEPAAIRSNRRVKPTARAVDRAA